MLCFGWKYVLLFSWISNNNLRLINQHLEKRVSHPCETNMLTRLHCFHPISITCNIVVFFKSVCIISQQRAWPCRGHVVSNRENQWPGKRWHISQGFTVDVWREVKLWVDWTEMWRLAAIPERERIDVLGAFCNSLTFLVFTVAFCIETFVKYKINYFLHDYFY